MAQVIKKIGHHWGLVKAQHKRNRAEDFPAQPGPKGLGESARGRVRWDNDFDSVRIGANFRDEIWVEELGVLAEGGKDEIFAGGRERRRLGSRDGGLEG